MSYHRSVYLVTDLCRGGELFELLNSGKSQVFSMKSIVLNISKIIFISMKGFVFREDRASQLMRDMISGKSSYPYPPSLPLEDLISSHPIPLRCL